MQKLDKPIVARSSSDEDFKPIESTATELHLDNLAARLKRRLTQQQRVFHLAAMIALGADYIGAASHVQPKQEFLQTLSNLSHTITPVAVEEDPEDKITPLSESGIKTLPNDGTPVHFLSSDGLFAQTHDRLIIERVPPGGATAKTAVHAVFLTSLDWDMTIDKKHQIEFDHADERLQAMCQYCYDKLNTLREQPQYKINPEKRLPENTLSAEDKAELDAVFAELAEEMDIALDPLMPPTIKLADNNASPASPPPTGYNVKITADGIEPLDEAAFDEDMAEAKVRIEEAEKNAIDAELATKDIRADSEDIHEGKHTEKLRYVKPDNGTSQGLETTFSGAGANAATSSIEEQEQPDQRRETSHPRHPRWVEWRSEP